jgi:hypothetical protein
MAYAAASLEQGIISPGSSDITPSSQRCRAASEMRSADLPLCPLVLILAPVRLLREELQLLQEPGSYVGEVVKVMGKTKVLVKVQPEGKYGTPFSSSPPPSLCSFFLLSSERELTVKPIFSTHNNA